MQHLLILPFHFRRGGDAAEPERRDPVLVGVTKQVVTVAVPDQHPGSAHIFRAAVFQFLLPAAVVLIIGERNLVPAVACPRLPWTVFISQTSTAIIQRQVQMLLSGQHQLLATTGKER